MAAALTNVLVEGPDCAGKSTLVKELHNRLRLDARFLGHKETPSQFRRYLTEYAAAHETVFDRGHLSELVYSQVLGRPAPFSKREATILNGISAETQVVVLALPDEQTAIGRYRDRNEHVLQKVGETELLRALDGFERCLEFDLGTNVVVYRSRDYDELELLLADIRLRMGR